MSNGERAKSASSIEPPTITRERPRRAPSAAAGHAADGTSDAGASVAAGVSIAVGVSVGSGVSRLEPSGATTSDGDGVSVRDASVVFAGGEQANVTNAKARSAVDRIGRGYR